MIETRIYKCEYCGAEFDNEYEADCHEWVCRYKDVKKRDGSNLRFYKEDGSEIKFDNAAFVLDDFDDVEAFTIGNDSDVKFIADFFEWHEAQNLAFELGGHRFFYLTEDENAEWANILLTNVNEYGIIEP